MLGRPWLPSNHTDSASGSFSPLGLHFPISELEMILHLPHRIKD